MEDIVIKRPDWAKDRTFYGFYGRELYAVQECRIIHQDGKHKPVYLPLKVKTGRCSGCGACCNSNGIARSLLEDMRDALLEYAFPSPHCPFITLEGCLLKGWIPFSCAKSVCTDFDGCTERVEVVH